MNFMDALRISSSGLTAQRVRMTVISSNLANMHTTRTPEGGPYKRKDVVFTTEQVNDITDRAQKAGRLLSTNLATM